MVEVRVPVYNDSCINGISKNVDIRMDANNATAFFYGIDNNVTTENLKINTSRFVVAPV